MKYLHILLLALGMTMHLTEIQASPQNNPKKKNREEIDRVIEETRKKAQADKDFSKSTIQRRKKRNIASLNNDAQEEHKAESSTTLAPIESNSNMSQQEPNSTSDDSPTDYSPSIRPYLSEDNDNTKNKHQSTPETNKAATIIQSVIRGNKSRKKTEEFKSETSTHNSFSSSDNDNGGNENISKTSPNFIADQFASMSEEEYTTKADFIINSILLTNAIYNHKEEFGPSHILADYNTNKNDPKYQSLSLEQVKKLAKEIDETRLSLDETTRANADEGYNELVIPGIYVQKMINAEAKQKKNKKSEDLRLTADKAIEAARESAQRSINRCDKLQADRKRKESDKVTLKPEQAFEEERTKLMTKFENKLQHLLNKTLVDNNEPTSSEENIKIESDSRSEWTTKDYEQQITTLNKQRDIRRKGLVRKNPSLANQVRYLVGSSLDNIQPKSIDATTPVDQQGLINNEAEHIKDLAKIENDLTILRQELRKLQRDEQQKISANYETPFDGHEEEKDAIRRNSDFIDEMPALERIMYTIATARKNFGALFADIKNYISWPKQ